MQLTLFDAPQGAPPVWIVWENVPGVFSTKDNAFGAFLGGLGGDEAALEPQRKWTDAGVVAGPERVAAWRTLDAQYFGLAQRRRRVFVLARGGARGYACADALLPLIESRSGHPAPRREAGQVAPTVPARRTAGGGLGTDFDCDGGLIPQTVGALCDGAHMGGGLNGQDAYSGRIFAVRRQPAYGADGEGHQHDVRRGADVDPRPDRGCL